jgi:hypothetical protein
LVLILVIAGNDPVALAFPTASAETSPAAAPDSNDPTTTPDGFALALYRAILSDALTNDVYTEARYEIGDLPVEDGTASLLSGPAVTTAAYRNGPERVGDGVRLAMTVRRGERDGLHNGASSEAPGLEIERAPVFELMRAHDPLRADLNAVVGDDAHLSARGAADQRLLVAAINSTFEANIVEAIHEIFEPTKFGVDSIRFSLFGRGEFALTRSPDTQALSVLDLGTGLSVTVPTGFVAAIPFEPVTGDSEQPLTFSGFMRELGRHLLVLLTRPSVIGLLGIGCAFWLFWWLRRRNVASSQD